MSEATEITLRIVQAGHTCFAGRVPVPIELGRRRMEHRSAFEVFPTGGGYRMGIVESEVAGMPRSAVVIRVDRGALQVQNVHPLMEINHGDDRISLGPGQSKRFEHPETLYLPGDVEISLSIAGDVAAAESSPPPQKVREADCDPQFRSVSLTLGDAPHQSLNKLLSSSGSILPRSERVISPEAAASFVGFDQEELANADPAQMAAVALVAKALDVLRRDIGSEEFLVAAAGAVASMIDLDETCVILRVNERWRVEARFDAGSSRDTDTGSGDDPSLSKLPPERLPAGCSQILKRVLADKNTFIFEPRYGLPAMGSMEILDRAVAGPLLGPTGEVTGVLYGHRRAVVDRVDQPIGPLEAKLLELMAGAVSSALNQRRELLIRSNMERFFPPAIAQRLRNREDVTDGRDAEVTLMFCDIRGFSRVSERIGAARTIEWINHVFSDLSRCVENTGGVLVNYIGDE